jgi:4-hydroxy-tetrahydrodipicolinate synthase
MGETPTFSGIIGACLTPFDGNGKVNLKALAREIDFIVQDADAISIGAVEAAEYTMLAPAERKALLRRGAELVEKRKPLILGTSSPTVRGSLELAEVAASAGADYVQVLMPLRPWGGQPTVAELVQYFIEIADRTPLPMVAYHNPGPGADPSIEALVRLSEIDQVHCFKESSRDITKITRLIELIDRSGNARYFTTMQPLLMTLLMGGSGGTMPPPGTRIGAEVVRAFRAGDLETARDWQRCYSTFPGKWASYGLPPVMKAAMRHLGIDLGEPHAPYAAVSPDHDAEIGEFLRSAGLRQSATAAL